GGEPSEILLPPGRRRRSPSDLLLTDEWGQVVHQAPDASQEPVRAFHALVAPLQVLLRRRGKKGEEARRVRAVRGDEMLRVHDVLLRLGHLLDAAPFDWPAAVRAPPPALFASNQLAG